MSDHAETDDTLSGTDSPDPGATESVLWVRWREGRDIEARHSLIELHLPYARMVAASFYANRFSNDVEFEDYYQLACVGLIEALDRFDPNVGVKFRTFASRRIHGSIVDGLERATEKQQQIATRQRLLAQRRESISEKRVGAETSGNRTSEQLANYVAEAGLAFALSWLLDGTGMLETDEKAENIPFYRSIALRELRDHVVDLVKGLPPQERIVIHDHYLQGVPFEDISNKLGLTRGRISQIHRSALLHLRGELSASGACDLAL